MTPHTTTADLLGNLEVVDGKFVFCLGPFAEAVKDGLTLVLAEANLAPDGSRAVLIVAA